MGEGGEAINKHHVVVNDRREGVKQGTVIDEVPQVTLKGGLEV